MTGAGFSAPDGIEPVVGWRYWGADAGWLTSINRFSTWVARQTTTARCSYAPMHDDVVPHERCSCGVYAVRDLDVLKQVADPTEGTPEHGRAVVVGTVAMWGRIVPGEWGWRGQHAYPKELWLVADTVAVGDDPLGVAAALEGAYQVPVSLCDATWAMPRDERPPEDADHAAMGAAAWDLAHSLDRLAGAANRGMSAYEVELRRFFERAGIRLNRPAPPPS